MDPKRFPTVWQRNPMISAKELKTLPAESFLHEMISRSVKNISSQSWLAWKVNEYETFFIGVMTHGLNDHIDWTDTKSQGDGASEWKLIRESFGKKTELWSLRTGDISLLHSLINSEHAKVLNGGNFSRPNRLTTTEPGATPQHSVGTEGGFIAAGSTTATTTANTPTFQTTSSSSALQNTVKARLGVSNIDQNIGTKNAAAAMPDAPGLMLAGNVQDVDIPNIMQSINLCKMTGRLTVSKTLNQIEIFFENGELLHARLLQSLHTGEITTGNDAVLDLFTWTDGTFQFQHKWKPPETTITRRIHSLLLEGATLQDYQASLLAKNCTLNSVICINPIHNSLGEAEFETILKNGIPSHLAVQKEIFIRLRKPERIESIVSELRLKSSAWIPIIFNLLNLELIILAS